jgi:4-amino-4-deoxy-L-arabinose transferase-like glycosyltransferase
MSTAAIVYLACGVLLRIQIGPRKWPYFAALGAILGLGYLSKAAMFPLAFIFLFAATSSDDGFRLKLAHLFVALLTFSMTAGPYAAALSSAKGRLTFSDTGKLSYVWFVDPGTDVVPDQHWQGGPAGYGQPLHPTRLLYNDPALYEFAAPIGGTYPPGTDPSYWYDGVQVRFDPAKVWAIARWNVEFYWNHFLAALLAGLLLLTCVGGRPAGFVLALVERWRIVVPAVCGLGMYAMTTDFFQNTFPQQPSTRFIASFAVVLFAAGVTAIRFKPSAATRRLVLGLTCAGLLFAGWGLSGRTVQEIKAAIHNKQQNKHWRSAQVLRRLGIGPGSRVAIIGPEYDHEFWARLARVKIIAQVPDGNAFLAKDFPVRALIFLLLEHAGADAVVWKQDKDQGYSAYFFHPVK